MKILMIIVLITQTAVSAQELSDERLLENANNALEGIAERNGYLLLREESRLSSPASNLLIPINTGVAVVGGAAGAFIATLGVPVVGGAAVVAVVVAGSAVVVTGSVAGGATIIADVELKHEFNYILFVKHFRTELHYSVQDLSTDETLEGSCIFFFSVDRENNSYAHEIDNCTHDAIFPQDEKGELRIGEDGPDFWDWGQKSVVATGQFDIL